jgi:tellurite methyltransferase
VYPFFKKHQENGAKIRIKMPDWNSLFMEKANRWEDPQVDVVALATSGLLPKNALVLDFGCGAGRHLKYLEGQQYSTTGMDIAPNGLHAARATLSGASFPVRLVRADMSDPLPFSTDSFDSVISIHVIFHNPVQIIKRTLSEIHRVIKPGGIFLVTFNATFSTRFGKGIELEEGTWIPDIGVDRGIPHHFSTLKDAAALMDDFKVTNIHLEEIAQEGAVSAHWIVTAQKSLLGRT